MRAIRFWQTLHFRLSLSFVGLLLLFGAAYYLWVDATVLSPDSGPGEDEFYDRAGRSELDSLVRGVPPAASPGRAGRVFSRCAWYRRAAGKPRGRTFGI